MPAAATSDILYAVEGAIGVVTLNRPQARNALTMSMYERLSEICRETQPGGPVKALIIRGAGGKAFASGTDISEFSDFTSGAQGVAYEAKMGGLLAAIEGCAVPTIAALAGACTGGGAAIAACCDLRLGSADLRFGFPIARTLGNALGVGILTRVVALIGLARTKDLLLQARLMGAEEALRVGLITEILPTADALDARAREVAVTVAGHAPVTIRACKTILGRLTEAQIATVDGRDMLDLAYGSADFREGRDAFLAKRPAKWTGK
jgi:enoyl-CoA hydratase